MSRSARWPSVSALPSVASSAAAVANRVRTPCAQASRWPRKPAFGKCLFRRLLQARGKFMPGLPQHFVRAAAQHQVARIIVKTAQRHAATLAEGALGAVEQTDQPFVVIAARIKPARVTQREHEPMNLLRLCADPDPQLAIIGLGLLARPRGCTCRGCHAPSFSQRLTVLRSAPNSRAIGLIPAPRSLRAAISLINSAPNLRSSAAPLAAARETIRSRASSIAPFASLLRRGEFQTIFKGEAFHTLADKGTGRGVQSLLRRPAPSLYVNGATA